MCHLLALLGAHRIFHVSGLRVNINFFFVGKKIVSAKFKTRPISTDTISYFQDLLLIETWEVIYQEHDIKEIFNNFLGTYLSIIVVCQEKLSEREKRLHYNVIIANSENKVKKTWKIIKNLTGKIQNSQHVSPSFKVDGVVHSHEQAAGAFNNYFLNITENLNLHIAKNNKPI